MVRNGWDGNLWAGVYFGAIYCLLHVLILVHPYYFTESSSQLRGANLAEHREEGEEEGEEVEEVEGKDGVELVQMSKANQKSHQIVTIELSKTSAF